MTIVLLASVSLFALVVTSSRPILSSDTDFAPTHSTLQTSVQTPFRIHPSKDDLVSDATRFHFQKSEQQIESLSEHGTESVAAIASFGLSLGKLPLFDTLLDATVDAQDTFNDLAGSRDEPAPLESVVDKQEETGDESPSVPLVVLAFSFVAAFLALACVALTLHIINSLRSQMLASKTAWQLLPRFWTHPTQENTNVQSKYISCGGCLLLKTERLDIEAGSGQRHELHPADKLLYFDAVSDIESEWDDVEEKYQDALAMSPLPLIHDLPVDDVSHSSDNPLLMSSELGSYPLDSLTTSNRSNPLMRELCPSSPVTRPAWSVREMGSPAFGLPLHQGDIDDTLQPLIHPRRRAYRSPVPELDIALAMQLRPGLGIGADSAWMVRFLMAIFGWFAVALTGNAR